MSEAQARPIPLATYRLQFRKELGFDQAAELAPYLAALGVSHVYASSFLKARPESTHGYDIVDHNALNPELGDAGSFERMVAEFRRVGLGQILDFVPNHMGVGGADNAFWLDVLEWGEESEFAGWFDIEWQPDRNFLKGKVLVPFLGDQYGAALEQGALTLGFDANTGEFAVWAYDTHKLSICPLHYACLLDGSHSCLAEIAKAFSSLPGPQREVAGAARALKTQLAERVKADPQAATTIERAVDLFNGTVGDLQSWSRLDALIREQFWRPTYFRVAADDINYRRFFNINELAGIRVENTEVFDRIHRLVFRLIGEGVLDGLRLDHIDGLFDPKAYCLKLRESAPRPVYLVVEKILAPHESLREDWETDGTTGYEFANLLTGLLIDPDGETSLTSTYAAFVGEQRPFAAIVRESKLRIMENEMAGELNVLAREAARLARSNLRTQDFTNNVIRRALREIVACFPVYRTYVDATQTTDADRRDIDWAVAQARRYETALDPSVFGFLHKVLSRDILALGEGFEPAAIARVAMRIQQFSGPVMAKGLEDTAFYRYNRSLALNEVGGNPDRFGVSIAQFHAANQLRLKRTPHALLSTSTHDTKRGEDARARLAVLSEIPDEWASRVQAWSRILRAPEAGSVHAAPPNSNDEYAFYQLLLAAWPPELLETADESRLEDFRQRIEEAMVKSVREAKLESSWVAPNEDYERPVLSFIARALDGSRANPFLASFVEFAADVARLGVQNSLVQTVLKLTVPGVPDIYQGAELWDLNLVDPDNRRPVDFATRRAFLDSGAQAPLGEVLQSWQDGRIKQRMIADLLRLRARHPTLFSQGTYEPVDASGPASNRVCAFIRSEGELRLFVAVSLRPYRARIEGWEATLVPAPGDGSEKWISVFDGSQVRLHGGAFDAGELFSAVPIAVLISEPSQRG